jgi:hypothetical protein
VGVRDEVPLLPYGLILPSAIFQDERTRIRRAYEEITMSHYTLFCNLAGAHAHARILNDLEFPWASRENWFAHWESFESLYLHLGISLNETYHLWDLLFLLRGLLDRDPNGKLRRIRGGEEPSVLREKEFKSAKKLTSWRRSQNLLDYISNRRNNITHYARGVWKAVGSRIAVPLRARPNTPWSVESKTKQWWLTNLRTKLDLEQVEDLINESHGVLIVSFERFLKEKRITVNR